MSALFLMLSMQLLSVLCVAPRTHQNSLLAAFREKHQVGEDTEVAEESPASHGQSAVINTILSRLFKGGEVEQISREEFSRLFGSVRRQLRIQDENGVDAGIQYDFVPHVESETVPETATYTFFLRTEKPQIFLFDDNINDPKKNQTTEKTPRRPKDFQETKQETENPISNNETEFAIEEKDKFIEEERQSRLPNAAPTQDISSFLDDLEGEEENEIDDDAEFSSLASTLKFEGKEPVTSSPGSMNNMINEIKLDGLPAGFDRSSVESHPIEEKKEEILTKNKNGSSYKDKNLVILDSTSELKNLTTDLSGNSKGNISKATEQLEDFFVNKFEIMKVLQGKAEENDNALKINQADVHGTKFDGEESSIGLGENSTSDSIQNNGATENLKIDDISKLKQPVNDAVSKNILDKNKSSASDDEDARNTAEREGKKQDTPNTTANKNDIAADISHTFVFEDADERSNTLNNDQKNMTEPVIEETTKVLLLNKAKGEEINNNSTYEDTDVQLDMRPFTLNDSAMNKNDQKIIELIMDKLDDTVTNGTEGTEVYKRDGSWLKAIPFLAYWVVKYIRSDPQIAVDASEEEEMEIVAQAITDNIVRVFEEFNEENESGELDENLFDVTEDLTNNLLKIASKTTLQDDNTNENDNSTINTSNKAETIDTNSSIHGDAVNRNNEIPKNQNFNALSTQPNPCNCKHGGECLPESQTCYCSHGFTGAKCQKRIRKIILVGGLTDVSIRLDSELVTGQEVPRCSPPAFPRPVMAATGQTAGDTVVVCGGATLIGGRLSPTNRCHFWKKSESWSPPLLMSKSRAWAASVLTPSTNENQMVIFGGVDQNNVTLDSIEVIDIKARKSIKIGLTLPKPLAGHCAVQLNSSHTFVAGGAVADLAGFGGSAKLSDQAWILSEAGWTPAGHLAQARSAHSCSTVVPGAGGLEVLVVGGVGLSRVGTRMVLDSVEIYNVATGRWRTGQKLQSPVFGAGLLELAGQPILIGGRYQKEDQLLQSDSSYMYQQSWRTSTLRMRSPRDLAVTVAAPSFC